MRSATAKDFRTFYGREPLKIWAGGVVERYGKIAIFAGVTWPPGCEPVVFFDRRGTVSPITMHRSILRWLEMLRWAGATVVYSHCDKRIKDAEKWLTRLGFLAEPGLQDIWKKEL